MTSRRCPSGALLTSVALTTCTSPSLFTPWRFFSEYIMDDSFLRGGAGADTTRLSILTGAPPEVERSPRSGGEETCVRPMERVEISTGFRASGISLIKSPVETPSSKSCRIGLAFFPSSHSPALRAGNIDGVLGYRSLWTTSTCWKQMRVGAWVDRWIRSDAQAKHPPPSPSHFPGTNLHGT